MSKITLPSKNMFLKSYGNKLTWLPKHKFHKGNGSKLTLSPKICSSKAMGVT